MEFIASLRQQLDVLCAEPSIDPNWLLTRLKEGLAQRYGRLAVGFVRRRVHEPDQVQLLGLIDDNGTIAVPISNDFRPDGRHPTAAAEDVATEAWIRTDRFGPWSDDRITASVRRFRAAFLTPWLIDKPADWHVLVLSPIAPPGGMSQDRGLSLTANLLATNLLRALDAERLAKADEWIEREMDEIARLQALLQPDPDVTIGGVDIAFSSEIYHYAGGDYFDLPILTHLVPESDRVQGRDYWGVMIADVSGHGPSAAVEAAMMDAITRTYAGPVGAPGEFIAYLNRHLFTRRPRAAFVTAFVANFDARERSLRFVNCGHPVPLYRWASGEIGSLPVETGIPLRIMREASWPVTERRMAAGDMLLLFTDGVTETRAPGGEQLGRSGLEDLLATVPAGATAAEALDHVRAGVLAHQDGRAPQDDETLIVIRFGE